MDIEEDLYMYGERLDEATNKSENVKDYLGIIEAEGASVKAKQLAAQLIPKFFKYFPTLSEQAINRHVALCKDEEIQVCLPAILGLPLFCKDTPEYCSKLLDKLRPPGENEEHDAVKDSLMLILGQIMKKDKMHQEETEEGGVSYDLPPSIVSPADFGSNVDISRCSQFKIGVIDSGCCETPTSHDLECFGRKPILKSFHLCEAPAMISPHGFSCASIIGGKSRKVDFFGVCDEEIRGVLPDVQLYAYGVGCDSCGTTSELVCNAIDEAIKDGIKVISISQAPYNSNLMRGPQSDMIGKKLLLAHDKFVLACLAHGNDGPLGYTARNAMPWGLIVGACTTGKILVTDVEIAVATTATIPPDVNILERKHNRKGEFMIVDRIQGVSLNVIDSDFRKLRIMPDSENKECVLSGDDLTQYILVNHVNPRHKSLIVSPGVSSRFWASICKEDINKLCSWRAKFRDEQLFVRILVSQYQNDERGVLVADFSSRGPSKVYQNNLTPDVVAPGCSVLMSHPSNYALNQLEHEKHPYLKKLFKDHKIGSGSSYACPLVAAYALIVYSHYPHWYPSAVKSALITTASSFAARDIPGNEFEFGAGAINLERALDPGLVYEEYGLNFQRYVDGVIEIFNLNLPTFAASFPHSHRCCEQTFVRKLKNVGKGNGAYNFKVDYFKMSPSEKVMITAEPDFLEFQPDEEKKFILKVKIYPRPNSYVSALIKWVPTKTDRCCVCSPLIVYHHSEINRPVVYEPHKSQKMTIPL